MSSVSSGALDTAGLARRLQATLDEEIGARETTGATADLSLDGEPIWSGASGASDPVAGTPMTPGATFPIYSITKTFTAVSALRLARSGVVVLDDNIARWLPGLAYAGDVSLRQLLAQTAGVFNYSLLPDYHADVLARPSDPWRFADFVEHAAAKPLDFSPGTGWNYSNTGYTLARHILEQATGRSFGALIEQTITDPLGLANTRGLETLDQMQTVVPGYSTLFAAGGSQERSDVRSLYHPGWCGTGLLAATGPDLCRFFDAVFDGTLLDENERSQMLTLTRVPGMHPPAVEPSYGLGIMADPGAPQLELGHGGGGPGWNLRASHWPSFHGRRLSLSVLCNHDADEAWPIGRALSDTLSAVLTGLPAPGPG